VGPRAAAGGVYHLVSNQDFPVLSMAKGAAPVAFPLHSGPWIGKLTRNERTVISATPFESPPASGCWPSPMKTYPIFANLTEKPCLVVGGGAVGERKVQDLRLAGAQVTVVSPRLSPALADLARAGKIRHRAEDFRPEHLDGMALVMAATDDAEVNERVFAAARDRSIWVNVADAPELCTFIVPAMVRRGDLTVAISTGGASPALARKLREELQQHFGPEYVPYLELLKSLRERLLEERRGHPDNARLFHRLVDSPLLAAMARGDRAEIVKLLEEVLGNLLSPQVLGELVAQAFKEPQG
jgi:precorrin-2 dehydrogenase/sirohydrochlorin ferrochelatase